VQATLLGASLTTISSTAFVMRFTRPEEYERGRLQEEARMAEKTQRAELEAQIRDALKEPTQVVKLEKALERAKESGNFVTAALLAKLQEELQAATEREVVQGKQRDRTTKILKQIMGDVSDPCDPLFPLKQLEQAVEFAHKCDLRGELVKGAEERLLDAKRVLRERTAALRRMLLAAGAMAIPEEWDFGSMMQREVPKLLGRAEPAARKANRTMLAVLKKARSAGLASLAKSTTPVPATNLDCFELAAAIHDARSKRVPTKVRPL
jgi:hypothetical protein